MSESKQPNSQTDEIHGLCSAFNEESGVFGPGTLVRRSLEEDIDPHDPEYHLSFEQKQVKEDVEKSRHDNPQEELAGRRSPISLSLRSDIKILQKQKHNFLLFVQITLAQNRIQDALKAAAEFPEAIQKMGEEYRKKQETTLDDLSEIRALKNKAQEAIEHGEHTYKNGTYQNSDLNEYMILHLKYSDVSLEDWDAMSHKQKEDYAKAAVTNHKSMEVTIGKYSEDLGTVAEIFEKFDQSGELTTALKEILSDQSLSDKEKLEHLANRIEPEMKDLIRDLKEANISDHVLNEALEGIENASEHLKNQELQTTAPVDNFFSM